MGKRRELAPAQESTWMALEGLGLNPEDYYDFDADEIIAFPSMPMDLQKRLAEIRRQTRQALDGLEK